MSSSYNYVSLQTPRPWTLCGCGGWRLVVVGWRWPPPPPTALNFFEGSRQSRRLIYGNGSHQPTINHHKLLNLIQVAGLIQGQKSFQAEHFRLKSCSVFVPWKGQHISKVFKIKHFLIYSRGGGSSLIGNFPKIFAFLVMHSLNNCQKPVH